MDLQKKKKTLDGPSMKGLYSIVFLAADPETIEPPEMEGLDALLSVSKPLFFFGFLAGVVTSINHGNLTFPAFYAEMQDLNSH